MLGVGDCVPEHIVEELVDHLPGVVVDGTRNSFDATSSSESPDGSVGDSVECGPFVASPVSFASCSSFASHFV